LRSYDRTKELQQQLRRLRSRLEARGFRVITEDTGKAWFRIRGAKGTSILDLSSRGPWQGVLVVCADGSSEAVAAPVSDDRITRLVSDCGNRQ
jgi:hypothetical protein